MIGFMFWFLFVCCVLAIVIIAGRWILGLAGITIPPPLMAIIGILLFLILLFALFHFVGVGAWNGPHLN